MDGLCKGLKWNERTLGSCKPSHISVRGAHQQRDGTEGGREGRGETKKLRSIYQDKGKLFGYQQPLPATAPYRSIVIITSSHPSTSQLDDGKQLMSGGMFFKN